MRAPLGPWLIGSPVRHVLRVSWLCVIVPWCKCTAFRTCSTRMLVHQLNIDDSCCLGSTVHHPVLVRFIVVVVKSFNLPDSLFVIFGRESPILKHCPCSVVYCRFQTCYVPAVYLCRHLTSLSIRLKSSWTRHAAYWRNFAIVGQMPFVRYLHFIPSMQ